MHMDTSEVVGERSGSAVDMGEGQVLRGPEVRMGWVLTCGTSSVRNLASNMTADRHRQLQAFQQRHRTT